MRSFSLWKRSISWFCLPNSLASMMPEIESVSWVIAVTSAAASCDCSVTRFLRSPTNFDMTTKTGIAATDTAVSSHDRMNMAASVLMKMTVFESTLESVLVTTFCTPPTSLAMRDCISPVRVPVKKPSDWRWRCV